jgi:hypothetical protein
MKSYENFVCIRLTKISEWPLNFVYVKTRKKEITTLFIKPDGLLNVNFYAHRLYSKFDSSV